MNVIPYGGGADYIFISYAHADGAAVLPVVQELADRKYRVWYDEGIAVGEEWPEIIAGRLQQAALVIVFVSAASLRSHNCAREINFAVDRKKNMFCVNLDGSVPQGGIGMQLSVVAALDARGLSAQQVCDGLEKKCLDENLIGNEAVGGGKRRKRRKKGFNFWAAATVFFALLFAAAGTFLLGTQKSWFSSVAVMRGSEPYQTDEGEEIEVSYTSFEGAAARDILIAGLDGDITSLYLCGNAFVSTGDAIKCRDGEWGVGEKRFSAGKMTDLSGVAQKTALRELALVNEGIEDISALAALKELTYLDLSANPISDISVLGELTGLTTVKLTGTAVRDFSVLKNLPALRRVYISPDMVQYAVSVLDGNFDVIIKE